jgi:hypothetical protein
VKRLLVAIAVAGALVLLFWGRTTDRDRQTALPESRATTATGVSAERARRPTDIGPKIAPESRLSVQRDLGRIHVEVTAEKHAPVANAIIVLREGVTAETDASGRCQFTLEDRWRGRVAVAAEGYATWRSDEITCEVGEIVDLSVRLVKGIDFQVKVVNLERVPISGARVELCLSSSGIGVDDSDVQATARTNSDGLASFKNVRPVPITVAVRCQGYVSIRELVMMSSRGEPVEHVIILTAARSLIVHLIDEDSGLAVAGLRVRVMRSKGSGRIIGIFTSDERGDFVVDAPPDEEISFDELVYENFTILSKRKASSQEARVELVVRQSRELNCVVRRMDGGEVSEIVIDYWYQNGKRATSSIVTVGGACRVRDQMSASSPYFQISIPGYGSSDVEARFSREIRPDPHLVIVRPATTVTGNLIDHLSNPVPFTTVRVLRVSGFSGNIDRRAIVLSDMPTDRNGRFSFTLPRGESNARYAVKAIPKNAMAPLVFLCRGTCDPTAPIVREKPSIKSDVVFLPIGTDSVDLGSIQCFASANVAIRVISATYLPPYRVWLSPTDGNERSLSWVAVDSDEAGIATFSGIAPGVYFADALRASPESLPPIWVGAGRTKVFLQPGNNGVIDIPYALK